MCSKRAGTFTKGSCIGHDHDKRDREHDLLRDDRPCDRRGGHLGAHQGEPALRHRHARDLADARRQQGVEQEADEERRGNVCVVEATVCPVGSLSNTIFHTTALSRIESRLSPSDAITHSQATSSTVALLMFTERRASSRLGEER